MVWLLAIVFIFLGFIGLVFWFVGPRMDREIARDAANETSSLSRSSYDQDEDSDDDEDAEPDDRWGEGERGEAAAFDYDTGQGRPKSKAIKDWVSEGDYITGTDIKTGRRLSFEKSGIDQFWELSDDEISGKR